MTKLVGTCQSSEPVVEVALAERNSNLETLHLLSSPKNAERLLSAVRELDAGVGDERKLIEDAKRLET